jgi:Tfp pilus assembly protein PilO
MKKKNIPIALVVGIVILVAAAAAYMLLVRPKGPEAEKLDEQIVALQTKIAAARAVSGDETPKTTIKVADLVALAKAMPDETDMAGAILELSAAAEGAGVEFTAIQPGGAVPGTGYTRLPLTLTFEGSYYDLTDLFYRLRRLVTVDDGVLSANGRLFTLDSFDWHEAPDGGFPAIEATLTLSTYVYGSAPVAAMPAATGQPAAPPPSTETGSTTTAPATTEPATTTAPAEPTAPPPSTTTTPADASQEAAGVTP